VCATMPRCVMFVSSLWNSVPSYLPCGWIGCMLLSKWFVGGNVFLYRKVTKIVVNRNYGKVRRRGFVASRIYELSTFWFLTPVSSASTWICRWRRKHLYPKRRNNLTIIHVVITQIIDIWITLVITARKPILLPVFTEPPAGVPTSLQ
jgi:hypothetical protein